MPTRSGRSRSGPTTLSSPPRQLSRIRVDADVNAGRNGGSVTTELNEVRAKKASGSSWYGTIGSGGTPIDISSVGATVRLTRG